MEALGERVKSDVPNWREGLPRDKKGRPLVRVATFTKAAPRVRYDSRKVRGMLLETLEQAGVAVTEDDPRALVLEGSLQQASVTFESGERQTTSTVTYRLIDPVRVVVVCAVRVSDGPVAPALEGAVKSLLEKLSAQAKRGWGDKTPLTDGRPTLMLGVLSGRTQPPFDRQGARDYVEAALVNSGHVIVAADVEPDLEVASEQQFGTLTLRGTVGQVEGKVEITLELRDVLTRKALFEATGK